jgi:lipoprotein NlpI
MQAYMNRGIAYHYSGNMEKACEDVTKAYELGFGLAKQYLEENCGKSEK